MINAPRVLLHSFQRQHQQEPLSPSRASTSASQASYSTYASQFSQASRSPFSKTQTRDYLVLESNNSIHHGSIASSSRTGTGKSSIKLRNPFKKKNDLVSQIEKAEKLERERAYKQQLKEEETATKRSGLVRQGTKILKRRFSLNREFKATMTPWVSKQGHEEEEEMIMLEDGNPFQSSLSFQAPISTFNSNLILGSNRIGLDYDSYSDRQVISGPKPIRSDSLVKIQSRLNDAAKHQSIEEHSQEATPKKPRPKARPKSIYMKRPLSTVLMPSSVKNAAKTLKTDLPRPIDFSRHITTKEELLNCPLPLHTPQGLPSRYRPYGTTIFDIYPDEDLDYHPTPPFSTRDSAPNFTFSSTYLQNRTADERSNQSTNIGRPIKRTSPSKRHSRVFALPNALFDLWQYGLDDIEAQEVDDEDLVRRRVLPIFAHIRSSGKIPTRGNGHTRNNSQEPSNYMTQGFRMEISSPSASSRESESLGSGGVVHGSVERAHVLSLKYAKPKTAKAKSNVSSPLDAYFSDFGGAHPLGDLTDSFEDYSPTEPGFAINKPMGEAF
ncbi:hypothetical protein L204_102803 [Cryptococcus depauperatus]|nr:hypothetical protein L204_00451 [Cryptococcus depauperatus CBS 7855]